MGPRARGALTVLAATLALAAPTALGAPPAQGILVRGQSLGGVKIGMTIDGGELHGFGLTRPGSSPCV